MREQEREWEWERRLLRKQVPERVPVWVPVDVWERGQERERERELARELERELARELAQELAQALVQLMVQKRVQWQVWQLDEDAAVDAVTDAAVDWVLDRWLGKADDQEMMAKDLAQRLQVESSILRIVLWVWKKTAATQPNHSEKRKIFISSCELWAPLEIRVDFTINGIKWGINGERLTFDDGNRDKLLTSKELNVIIDFAEGLRKDWEKSEFIARNADVGINRLYVHFDRQVDWDYDLYDFREQRMPCPRSAGKGIGMVW
ncbi:hypothetical protein FRC01_007505 [Tulasnella sp. 417]|nr:hypothetical protein FRC01_007505 [Tulasnella sp. 417]